MNPANPGAGRKKILQWYIDEYPVPITSFSAGADNFDPNMFPEEAMYILLNLAMGGNWWSSPVDGGFGRGRATVNQGELEIDWVRVFQKKNDIEDPNRVY